MREVNAILGKDIFLGRCGENKATFVTFDISDLQKVYGDGTVQLLHQRNGDKQPYPCAVEQTGDSATWIITNADNAVAGRGRAELQYYVGETLVKSETFTTAVERGLGAASETPPEPYEGWVEQVLGVASGVAENAEAAAQSANDAAFSAKDARTSASSAAHSAGTASQRATAAERSASAADASARQAEADRARAEAGANAAASSASNASDSASAAASSASAAASSASDAYRSKNNAEESKKEAAYFAKVAYYGQGAGTSFTTTTSVDQTRTITITTPLEIGRRYTLTTTNTSTGEAVADEILYTGEGFSGGFGVYVEPVSSTQLKVENDSKRYLRIAFAPVDSSVYDSPVESTRGAYEKAAEAAESASAAESAKSAAEYAQNAANRAAIHAESEATKAEAAASEAESHKIDAWAHASTSQANAQLSHDNMKRAEAACANIEEVLSGFIIVSQDDIEPGVTVLENGRLYAKYKVD